MSTDFNYRYIHQLRRRSKAILGLVATIEAIESNNDADSCDYAEWLANLAEDFGLKSDNLVPLAMGMPRHEWAEDDDAAA